MKILLISLSILLTQCTPPPPAALLPETSRIKVISRATKDGYAIFILRDTETGVEYLAHNHGLVKLEPLNAIKP